MRGRGRGGAAFDAGIVVVGVGAVGFPQTRLSAGGKMLLPVVNVSGLVRHAASIPLSCRWGHPRRHRGRCRSA